MNTLTALILVYTAKGLPLAIFILQQFMRQVPSDLKSGCAYRRRQRISHLLARPAAGAPAMATVAVFTMIPIWNDLWFPLILAPGERPRRSRSASQQFLGQFVTDWNAVLSSLSLAMLPDPSLHHLLAPADPRLHLGRSEITPRPLNPS